MNDSKYKLIILFGKSGAGKDYLLREVCKLYPNDINPIISDTTRPPRKLLEEDGVDYNFVTKEEFQEREHIEFSKFNNWYYGTPLSSLSSYKINIAVMNLDGIRQLYERDDLNIKLFYVSCDDKTRLLRQIEREPYPNIPEICRRFLADEEDFKNIFSYPFTNLQNIKITDVTECIEVIKETIDSFLADSGRIK